MKENFIEVEGLRIRTFEEGSGPAVLLLHGASLGSSADVWTGNLSDLAARGLRVIAYDQPGFGLSDNPEDLSVAYRTRFVLAFMDAVRLHKARLIGHSQSGRIAVNLALEHGERVPGIVVLATGSLLPPLPGRGKPDAAKGEEGGAAEPTLEDTRRVLEESLFDKTLITPAALQTRQRMSTGKNFRAFLERARARGGDRKESKQGSKPLWQRLGEVQSPLRLIYGREDRGHAAERAALAMELHPGLDLHLVDHCKHLVQWDAAEEFAALSGSFLADKT
ncbi:MAG TPA: alpha/beta hydrolase [Burkholderiales bacterium]|nr:alpha/beta hydrolase [Burkholderiales bacterium]